MKKFLACAIVALLSVILPTLASAQAPKIFECKQLGLSLYLPDNVNAEINEAGVLTAITPDELFAFTLIPFDLSKHTNEEVADAWIELAQAAKMDFKTADDLKISNDAIDGTYKLYPLRSGASAAGFAVINGTYNSFMVTLVAGNDYSQYLYTSLRYLTTL